MTPQSMPMPANPPPAPGPAPASWGRWGRAPSPTAARGAGGGGRCWLVAGAELRWRSGMPSRPAGACPPPPRSPALGCHPACTHRGVGQHQLHVLDGAAVAPLHAQLQEGALALAARQLSATLDKQSVGDVVEVEAIDPVSDLQDGGMGVCVGAGPTRVGVEVGGWGGGGGTGVDPSTLPCCWRAAGWLGSSLTLKTRPEGCSSSLPSTRGRPGIRRVNEGAAHFIAMPHSVGCSSAAHWQGVQVSGRAAGAGGCSWGGCPAGRCAKGAWPAQPLCDRVCTAPASSQRRQPHLQSRASRQHRCGCLHRRARQAPRGGLAGHIGKLLGCLQPGPGRATMHVVSGPM